MIRILLLASALSLWARQSAQAQIDVEYEPEAPHHLSLFLGGTHVAVENETGFTIGLDYEYRLSRLLGLGVVAERALGEIDATTLLAVADIHLWRGFALQVGPGVEFINEETFAVGRIGGLYEITFKGGLTVSPQVHYDISGGEDALLFGMALGVAF